MTADTASRARAPRFRLPRPALLSLIVAHVVFGVGLLGDSAGFLAIAIRRAISTDQAFREAARELLRMFALFFGIPLSFLALGTGIVLGLVTKWGLLRYPWLLAKEALIVTVILVGALVLSPLLLSPGGPDDIVLILGATWDVLALLIAATLGVFRPGRSFKSDR